MALGPLVSTEWLQERLGAPDLRVFDATVVLAPNRQQGQPPYRIESGVDGYRTAHVPGAGFLDLTRELANRDTPIPFQLPAAAPFAAALSGAGVGADSRVVVYSRFSMMWSTRMWWMLRTYGFDNAAVLDGGWEKWQREGRPTCSEPCSYPQASFEARMRAGLMVGKEETAAAMERAASCTLNALSPDVYAGSAEQHYGRAGHISGSHNVYYAHLLDPESGAFLPLAELRKQFEASGALQSERVITYCGGGISATMPALALTLLGHPSVAVYDGSLAEWAADPDLPMTTGPRP